MTKQTETTAALSPFMRLSQINVNDHVEKKNGLSYLSWAWAIAELFKADPDANWEFHAPQMFGESMMVSCTVRAFGKPIMMHLPVMDHRNKAIKNPDAFEVNKNMMRCLVKAIACHGLGLYLYSGEDLPEHEAEAMAKVATAKGVTPTSGCWEQFNETEREFLEGLAATIIEAVDFDIKEAVRLFYSNHLTQEEQVAIWSLIDSKKRSAIKKAKDQPTADELTAQA